MSVCTTGRNILALFCILSGARAITLKSNVIEFGTLIKASSQDCYFSDNLKRGQILNIAYVPVDKQNIDPEKDYIKLFVFDPFGNPINLNKGKQIFPEFDNEANPFTGLGEKEVHVSMHGDYKICISNTHAMSAKKVFFLMFIRTPAGEHDPMGQGLADSFANMTIKINDEDESISEEYNMTATEIRKKLEVISQKMEDVSYFQKKTILHNLRDYLMVMDSSNKINLFSSIIIVILMGVGFIQVVMVKSLFEEKRVFHRILK